MSEEKFDINTDLRDSMSEVYDKLNEGGAVDAPSTTAQPSAEGAAPSSPEAAPETPAPAEGERARGPDGKFVKTDKPAEPVKADGVIGAPETEKSKDQPEANAAPKGAPGAWSPKARQHWDALPLDIKEAVLKRESEFGRMGRESGEKVKAYQELDKALEPVTPLLDMQGVSKAEFVGNLVRAEAALRNPATRPQAFQYLAQQYGFDLSQMQPNRPQQEQVHPQIAALQQQIAQLQQTRAMEEQQVRARVDSEAESEIAAFANDPKNEFFADVRGLMGRYLEKGVAETLQEAYDLACRKSPEIAAILEARQQDALQKQLAQRATAQAAPVKKIVGTNVRGTAGNAPGAVPSIRDGMEQVWNKLVNGA